MSDVAIGSYEQHVAILETVDVSKVAFDEIGRVVLASVLRQYQNPATLESDSDGFVELTHSVEISAKFHIGGVVPDCCCVCERSIIICRGECCEEVLS